MTDFLLSVCLYLCEDRGKRTLQYVNMPKTDKPTMPRNMHARTHSQTLDKTTLVCTGVKHRQDKWGERIWNFGTPLDWLIKAWHTVEGVAHLIKKKEPLKNKKALGPLRQLFGLSLTKLRIYEEDKNNESWWGNWKWHFKDCGWWPWEVDEIDDWMHCRCICVCVSVCVCVCVCVCFECAVYVEGMIFCMITIRVILLVNGLAGALTVSILLSVELVLSHVLRCRSCKTGDTRVG